MAKIAIVIVMYKKKIQDTTIFPFLNQVFGMGIPVICYDNSPKEKRPQISNALFEYHHDPTNPGIAVAYNYASDVAATKFGRDALLLLDHDSKIDLDFITAMSKEVFETDVVAVVPRAFSDTRQLSPLAGNKYIDRDSIPLGPGVYKEPVMAINSGSLISLDFIKKIGGFDLEFPLDFLDHWLFFMIGRAQKAVKVLSLTFQHDLSVLNYKKMSHGRFDSILAGEVLYYTKYRTKFLARYKRQLLKRAIKLFLTVSDKYYCKRSLTEYRNIGKTNSFSK
ncbi:glycosyl transferase family 2 [Lapidilactobacillus luobeiensis]|uniref:glycosyl transferase family 2 n=1 Tax=Lapidilactobacillus luobeiensis TaxID=2950371 RepID=UPI0021C32787|nr:glycosyl transferase family 2 [Lapidilactobacillus luobeiensis]